MIVRLTLVLAILAVAFGIAVAPVGQPPVVASAHFKVIDVRAEYGHLVVEAQHFHPDGSHWFYETYTWQGREQDKHPRVVGPKGELYLASGVEAPKSADTEGILHYYSPEGEGWLRQSGPFLAEDSILGLIASIHQRRGDSSYTDGQYRVTTHPLDSTSADITGAPYLKQRFAYLAGLAVIPQPQNHFIVFNDPRPIDPYISSAWGTVSTFYPDSHAESTSVDGDTDNNPSATDWNTIRTAATGTGFGDSSPQMDVTIQMHSSTDNWIRFKRADFLFDTSSLPDTDTIDSAVYEFVSMGKTETIASQSIRMVTTTPASNTALVAGDYDQYGTVAQATDLTIASVTSDSSTYNTFTLNATGEGNISLTGITKFGSRIASDADDSEPTWAAYQAANVGMFTADETEGGEARPRLVVTHSPPPTAAITGTIGDGATEQEVRDGTGTIVITLTDATWDDPITSERQNIIDGLDAAESEANGWNAQVRDQIGVGSVVLTSSTIVTITITQSEVANYRVDANEVITVTVPASAHSGASAITATPTITITAAAESAALTGNVTTAVVRPSQIVAGGRTIIYTLTNTEWQDSGANFNAQRQAILDHLDSNLSDQNGWDARRSDFAVGNVARTSDTVVTVTLGASSAYAIPATETITATVPNEALLYGVDLSTSTFDIIPIFQSSGDRVSAAIDLSSVTNVAYCSLAWEATTPTSTTVTVDTSVNGGTSYTSGHTNGNCPTGISVGATLATITDFRVRVNLTSSVSGSTPTVDTLALVIDDATGQELYYQLNTTPSATLTDRSSSGTHTGTMSFPTAITGVSSTVGTLRSTRTQLTTQQALTVPQVASAVTGSATDSNIFSTAAGESGFSSLPGDSLVSAISTAGDGLPKRFVWFIFIGFLVIGMGAIALKFTANLMIAALTMGAGLGLWMAVGNGLMPGWVLFVFVPMAGALIMMRRGVPI